MMLLDVLLLFVIPTKKGNIDIILRISDNIVFENIVYNKETVIPHIWV